MRLAVAACAIALAVFAGVFGYLVVNDPALLNVTSSEPVAVPAPAESRPTLRTITVVNEAPPAVAARTR